MHCRIRLLRDLNVISLVLLGNSRTVKVGLNLFTIAQAFGPETMQENIYRATTGVVRSVLHDVNVCVLAYGQTVLGKTQTMIGSREDPGVNHRAIADLFCITKLCALSIHGNIYLF